MYLITKVIIIVIGVVLLLIKFLLWSYERFGDAGIIGPIIILMIILLIGKIRGWES